MAFAVAAFAVQAISSAVAADNAEKQAEANAAIAENNARYAADSAAIEEYKIRQQHERFKGDMRANYGASGVSFSGSAKWVMADTTAQMELDAATIRYEGTRQANSQRYEASMQRWQGQNAQTAAGLSILGSALSAGSSIYGSRVSGASAPTNYSIANPTGYTSMGSSGGGMGIRIK